MSQGTSGLGEARYGMGLAAKASFPKIVVEQKYSNSPFS